jgi:NAD(P)-dependent dehydrogenase (short-subunit alcohol dehydrogenase family)
MDLELHGKVALVTGSTSGIGEAVVRRLAREGASVVVHGRRAAEAERVVKAIVAEGGNAKAALGDLTDDAGAEAAATAALAAFGPVDILVNSAGVFRTDDWNNLDAADWIAQYDQNVATIVRIVKHILPPMRGRHWGRIIQMSSVGALMPSNTTVAYGGAKAAVAAFSTGLAKVLAGTGITVNTVTPGPVLTPMFEGWLHDIAKARDWDGDMPEWERRFATEVRPNPLGRVGRVEELADLITFLASPRAGFINGANIRVDGGTTPTV